MPGRRLPRTPALYDRKVKWPLGEGGPELHGEWKANYSPLKDHEQKVLEQYRQEIEEGLMTVMTLKQAIELYGDRLVIAATGAIAKKGQGPDGDIRVIYDGTNGVYLNFGTKIRDQVRYPTAPDVKAVLAEMAEEGGPHFGFVYNVAKARQRIPVLRCDWGLQACQLDRPAAKAWNALALEYDAGTEAYPGGSRACSFSAEAFSASQL